MKEERKEEVFEEIKELKAEPLEKAVKVEEKPKVIVEKKEEEFIVAGGNKVFLLFFEKLMINFVIRKKTIKKLWKKLLN